MNDNLVKTLRGKTEEADLDTILKKTLGGYSRKSVQEYLSMMRQQQYDMQQSFSEEMQIAQSERDRLARELIQANQRADAAEDALEQAKPLMEKAAGLEKDMEEAILRIQDDAVRLEELRQELERQKGEIQRLQNEKDALLSRFEGRETGIPSSEEEPAKEEAAHTNDTPLPERSEEMPETNSSTGTANLSEWPEDMPIQLALLAREQKNTVKQIEHVLRQEKGLFQTLKHCWIELENRRDQNQCLEAENEELSRRLSEQMAQNVSLDREITHIRTINENLKRKLDAALGETAKENTPNGSQDAGDVFLWNFEN